MDEGTDADGDAVQDARRDPAAPHQPPAWAEIQYADVLVYLLPVGGKLMRYDSIAVNTIVLNREGEVSSCDLPYTDDLSVFNANYLRLTRQVTDTCENHDIADSMVIGTSALAQYDIDGAVGMYSGIFNNPFLIWGRYRKDFFKTRLTVSFQFHHTQMDGAHAAGFIGKLQDVINSLELRNPECRLRRPR